MPALLQLAHLHEGPNALETAKGLIFKRQAKMIMVKNDAADLEQLRQLMAGGKLKAFIATIFSLERLQQAHEMMEEGNFTGKIAVEINMPPGGLKVGFSWFCKSVY